MHILFIVRSFSVGGVEIVTTALANKFVEMGHRVAVFSMMPTKDNISYKLNTDIHYYEGVGFNSSSENVKLLRDVYLKESIQIVINQWGLPFVPIRPAKKAAKGLGMKFISVFHNDPLTNGRIQGVKLKLSLTNNSIYRFFLRIQLRLFTAITSASMRYVYKMSDRFMVLSPAFIQNFKDFTGIRNPKKLVVQTNPVTIDTKDSELCVNSKNKEILFVGRLDYVQKRVNRILETWSFIESSNPEWKLTLLGDGPDKETLVELQKKLNLHRVVFEGVQNPILYYKRSSLLILASEFEGLPLVLAECMSYGVIPVVYGSFSSVYDIIEDGVDGIIIPKTQSGFDAHVMAERIKSMLADDETRNRMALAAIKKSKKYSIDKIYEQWMEVLNKL